MLEILKSNYPFYEKLAEELLEFGVLCEFDPREPGLFVKLMPRSTGNPPDAFSAALEIR
ncbi:MAG: hypothetical protein Ct9H300mP4_14050 [Gammaproteobacteria bacterium]|nr:MAG: hypothetical protein Ct9H300mP4_14050 [Gammaproteobacteria bacterium]